LAVTHSLGPDVLTYDRTSVTQEEKKTKTDATFIWFNIELQTNFCFFFTPLLRNDTLSSVSIKMMFRKKQSGQ
jgi:hypothetical protein